MSFIVNNDIIITSLKPEGYTLIIYLARNVWATPPPPTKKGAIAHATYFQILILCYGWNKKK